MTKNELKQFTELYFKIQDLALDYAEEYFDTGTEHPMYDYFFLERGFENIRVFCAGLDDEVDFDLMELADE